MQIQTTKIPQNVSKNVAAAQDKVPTQQQQQGETPKDSFATTVKNEAFGEARHFANMAGNNVGGAGGIIGASLGASAALAGGAIVGMAAGGAVAAPISQLFSSGGFDFIKTGLSTIGTGGQIGIGLGLITLAAGGWVVGDKLAGTAVKPFAYATGLATGAVKGTLRHLGQEAGALPPVKREAKTERPPIVNEKSAFMGKVKMGFGGIGALTGLAGGASLGLAIGAGTEVVGGLFAGDLGLSTVTRAGLIGAGIGGGTGAIVGGIGGMKVASMIHSGLNGIAETSRISQKLLEQDKRGNILDELHTRLETDKADFSKEKQAGDSNIASRETALNSRGEVLTQQQQVLNDKLSNEPTLTGARSDELYTEKTNQLGQFEARLDADKTHLDSEKVRLTGKEGDLNNLIRTEADNRRENHRNAEQGQYDSRKGNLESREKTLQTRESKINNIANDRVQAELQPLRDEAADARSSAASNQNSASTLRSEAANLEGRVGGILADARNYENRAGSQESDNRRLRSEESSLSSRESSLSSDLSSCQADKRRRDNGGGGGGGRDDSKHGGGGGRGRDDSKWG